MEIFRFRSEEFFTFEFNGFHYLEIESCFRFFDCRFFEFEKATDSNMASIL